MFSTVKIDIPLELYAWLVQESKERKTTIETLIVGLVRASKHLLEDIEKDRASH